MAEALRERQSETGPAPNSSIAAQFRRTRSGLLWWMGTHDMVSFDNTFTINWLGYDNVHEYYEAASPHNQLPNVTTPLLIINSRNDPLIPNVVNPGQGVASPATGSFVPTF
ncbi:hypothetical protein TeGR_g14263 [Tetraparma gracilis]|uniref:Peptidase S33 tripeptidyl aminopeptidase-like C-terminal domain-containing protein n=1 Tax=Tetraparma gracilis TaxID=2962635 RepID=A0ABQ6N415_9STRA|nr:hypothetical protein TeGR_g14263 [Tetraparma gracilis]